MVGRVRLSRRLKGPGRCLFLCGLPLLNSAPWEMIAVHIESIRGGRRLGGCAASVEPGTQGSVGPVGEGEDLQLRGCVGNGAQL